MEAICVKLDKKILKNIDVKMKEHNYTTRTDFIREAIRDKLNQIEKEEAIKNLHKHLGSLKGKARLSDMEARKAAYKELAKEKGIGTGSY